VHCAARADRTIVMCVCAEIENLNLFRVLFFCCFFCPSDLPSVNHSTTNPFAFIHSLFLDIFISFLFSSLSLPKQWTQIPSIKNKNLVTSREENKKEKKLDLILNENIKEIHFFFQKFFFSKSIYLSTKHYHSNEF
jgi:hypothetical protein